MRCHDRLTQLAACYGVLRRARLDSQDAYRAATREQLAALHRYGATIRNLVAAGHPDVMLALWPPRGLHWAWPASRRSRPRA